MDVLVAGTAMLGLNHGPPFFATAQRVNPGEKKFTTVIEAKTLLIIGLGGWGVERYFEDRRMKTRLSVSKQY